MSISEASEADKILQDALEAKEAMDDIIRDGARDVEEEMKLSHFRTSDGHYMDGNGDYITREEALEEADWRNNDQ